MRFDPNKKEDMTPVDPGIYHWICTGAKEAVNDKGQYIKVVLSVDIPGRATPMVINDFISDNPRALWKTEQFCGVVGIDFNEGFIGEMEIIGKEGMARFDYGRPRDGKQYLEVKEYFALSEEEAAAILEQANQNAEESGDSIPF